MTLTERVLRTIRARCRAGRGERVVVALSGGADSVALLHVLRELETQGELVLAGVAHFNHQMRGEEADQDEEFCRDLAASLGLAFQVARGNVRALASEQGRSVEDAARLARYAFLDEAADRLDASLVAVAHTVDDQAETFLLRLMRGAGPRGLSGIRPRAGRVIRPFIDVRRAELRAYLSDLGIGFREDSTNRDVTIPRNRVRLELIPYLEREFSIGVVDVLAREAAIAAEDDDNLTQQAMVAAGRVLGDDRPGVRTRGMGPAAQPGPSVLTVIDTEALRSLHPAIATRVARIALARQASNRFVGFEHAARLVAFVTGGQPGAAMSFPGQQAVHLGANVRLGPEPRRGKTAGAANSFRVLLSIPGEVTLDRQGWCVSAETLDERGWRARSWTSRGEAVAVASAPLKLPLSVRGRKPGDRFRPLGLQGAGKKLQDFMVDRKIPRNIRDSLPLVVDAEDRIVWVVGEAVAEDFRVTEPAKGVLLLKARRLGGLG